MVNKSFLDMKLLLEENITILNYDNIFVNTYATGFFFTTNITNAKLILHIFAIHIGLHVLNKF